MAQPISKRLMIAKHGDISRTVEVYTGGGRKRLDNAKPVVLGDGRSYVHFIDDPAVAPDLMTLRLIATRDDPFVSAAEQALDLHRRDPLSAGSVTLTAYADSGAVIADKQIIRAVIQEVRFPDGDTQTSGETLAEIIVQPRDVLA